MCADLLHQGHLIHLQKARLEGDWVIVGVLTDEAVQERKAPPIISYEERANIIRSLRYVDEVVPQTCYNPLQNIIRIKPDVLIESEDHLHEAYMSEIREKFNGKLVINPYYEHQSSTKIKKIIRARM